MTRVAAPSRPALIRAGLLSAAHLLLALAAAAIWAYTVNPSREYTTDFGTLPMNSQDEMRVAGELWLTMALLALAVTMAVLWWYRGPSRGPVGLGLLAVSTVLVSGIAGWVGGGLSAARGSIPTDLGVFFYLPASVDTLATALVPAAGAVLVYCVAAILVRDPTLRPAPRHVGRHQASRRKLGGLTLRRPS